MVPSFTPQPVPVHTQLVDFPLFSLFVEISTFPAPSKLYYYVKGFNFRLTLRFSFLSYAYYFLDPHHWRISYLIWLLPLTFPFRYYFTRLKVFVSFWPITCSSGLYSDLQTHVIHLPQMILSKLPSLTNLLNQICYDIICDLSLFSFMMLKSFHLR